MSETLSPSEPSINKVLTRRNFLKGGGTVACWLLAGDALLNLKRVTEVDSELNIINKTLARDPEYYSKLNKRIGTLFSERRMFLSFIRDNVLASTIIVSLLEYFRRSEKDSIK